MSIICNLYNTNIESVKKYRVGCKTCVRASRLIINTYIFKI